jgi:protein TonB
VNTPGPRAAGLVGALLLSVLAAAAPAPCTPLLQVYFAADFKDQPYQQTVYQRVAAAWLRPATSPKAGGKTVVIAIIARDGTIAPPIVNLKSDSEAWDAAALAAVKKAAPFEPLPKSYSQPSVEVHFHFACAG